VKRGAVVVLDPRTGETLASVSLPGYDPNLFVPSVSFQIWDSYLKDIGTPLLDRVSSARSAPGAVFQPFTALAALRAGKTPGTYACTPLTRGSGGGVRYGSVTRICRTSLREGAAHGPLTLEQALAKGCSSYFFQLGTEVGYPALFSMAEDLGLQLGTNIFGIKSPPLLPTMEELAKTRSSQRQLNDITTDFASGRGSPATILQMAALYSALANGKVWEPSLTKKSAGRPRLDLNTLPDLPEGLARVRSALREAVIHPQPWARSLTSSKAQIAALADSYATGAKGPHSEVFTHHYWMAGYAPADKPALAFVLYVDETSPDSTLVPDKLGPMVRRVVEEALALPADGSGEVKPVEEKSAAAQAPFDFNAAEISRQIKLLEAELKST
jgi:penicillin-binding protein 2